MLLVGLTGSIATGKSTVSSLLSKSPHNLPIIDADLLARKVVEPGTPAYRKIVDYFGPTTPDLLLPADESSNDGRHENKSWRPLNRPALGRRVFGDSEERKRDRMVLNGIVHPAVRWAMGMAVLNAYLRGYWAVVLDVPLLFESRLDLFCGVVIVVAVSDPEVQMKRLRDRDGHLSHRDVRERVASQGQVMEKVKRVKRLGVRGEVIWNDGGRGEVEAEVVRVMEAVRKGSPKWWALVVWVLPPLAVMVGMWNLGFMWWEGRNWNEEKRREKLKL
ncbi:MAG: hypothetical protein M1835_000178 [Candelina submexicana]|nr:MAG: hypothetical protein M1835_000178 [Candelina submexicana]